MLPHWLPLRAAAQLRFGPVRSELIQAYRLFPTGWARVDKPAPQGVSREDPRLFDKAKQGCLGPPDPAAVCRAPARGLFALRQTGAPSIQRSLLVSSQHCRLGGLVAIRVTY